MDVQAGCFRTSTQSRVLNAQGHAVIQLQALPHASAAGGSHTRRTNSTVIMSAHPPDSGGMVRASRRIVHSGVRAGSALAAASARRHLTQERGGGSVPSVATQPMAT